MKKDIRYNIMNIYVDDLIYTGNDKGIITKFKEFMIFAKKLEAIFICQKKYVIDFFKNFAMFESKHVKNSIVLVFKINRDVNGATMDNT
ncbi:hypothetical protein CR513_52915, partial [Mucuna pruriens]